MSQCHISGCDVPLFGSAMIILCENHKNLRLLFWPPLTDFLYFFFTSDHVFWILRDLTWRTSWKDGVSVLLLGPWCSGVTERCQGRLSNGSQMLVHELLIFSDSSSPAREQMRKIWIMYVFQKAEFIQNLKTRYYFRLVSVFFSLLCLSIIYFMK